MNNWFRKKTDPLKSREESLNAEIAAIESEIKKLNASLGAPSKTNSRKGKQIFGGSGGQRSDAGKAAGRQSQEDTNREPIFESVPRPSSAVGEEGPPTQDRSQSDSSTESQTELPKGGRSIAEKFRLWHQRFRRQTPSNPRLVNYLAAGSIQGLRPLRYEKRLARNRVILLAACFALLLWILATLFLPV